MDTPRQWIEHKTTSQCSVALRWVAENKVKRQDLSQTVISCGAVPHATTFYIILVYRSFTMFAVFKMLPHIYPACWRRQPCFLPSHPRLTKTTTCTSARIWLQLKPVIYVLAVRSRDRGGDGGRASSEGRRTGLRRHSLVGGQRQRFAVCVRAPSFLQRRNQRSSLRLRQVSHRSVSLRPIRLLSFVISVCFDVIK